MDLQQPYQIVTSADGQQYVMTTEGASLDGNMATSYYSADGTSYMMVECGADGAQPTYVPVGADGVAGIEGIDGVDMAMQMQMVTDDDAAPSGQYTIVTADGQPILVDEAGNQVFLVDEAGNPIALDQLQIIQSADGHDGAPDDSQIAYTTDATTANASTLAVPAMTGAAYESQYIDGAAYAGGDGSLQLLTNSVYTDAASSNFKGEFSLTNGLSVQTVSAAGDQTKVQCVQCWHCSRTFSSQAELTAHANAEHPVGRKVPISMNMVIHCTKCAATFSSQAALSQHMHAQHPMFYSRHQCSYCGALCRDTFDLMEHEQVHTGVDAYACEKCGRSFSKLHDRLLHECVGASRAAPTASVALQPTTTAAAAPSSPGVSSATDAIVTATRPDPNSLPPPSSQQSQELATVNDTNQSQLVVLNSDGSNDTDSPKDSAATNLAANHKIDNEISESMGTNKHLDNGQCDKEESPIPNCNGQLDHCNGHTLSIQTNGHCTWSRSLKRPRQVALVKQKTHSWLKRRGWRTVEWATLSGDDGDAQSKASVSFGQMLRLALIHRSCPVCSAVVGSCRAMLTHLVFEHDYHCVPHCQTCRVTFTSADQWLLHSCACSAAVPAVNGNGHQLQEVHSAFKKRSLKKPALSTNSPLPKPLGCLHCDCRFTSHLARKRHMRDKHDKGSGQPAGSSVWRCYACAPESAEWSGASGRRQLLQHMAASHPALLPVVCASCEARFLSTGALKRHVRRSRRCRHLLRPLLLFSGWPRALVCRAAGRRLSLCDCCFAMAVFPSQLRGHHCRLLPRLRLRCHQC